MVNIFNKEIKCGKVQFICGNFFIPNKFITWKFTDNDELTTRYDNNCNHNTMCFFYSLSHSVIFIWRIISIEFHYRFSRALQSYFFYVFVDVGYQFVGNMFWILWLSHREKSFIFDVATGAHTSCVLNRFDRIVCTILHRGANTFFAFSLPLARLDFKSETEYYRLKYDMCRFWMKLGWVVLI